MAAPNEMVTFQDLQDLIDNEGFLLNNAFTPSNKCPTKVETENAIQINTLSLWDSQLVQRSLIIKAADPVDNPPTDPTSILIDATYYDGFDISWSGATDDNGIASYNIFKSSYDGSVWSNITQIGSVTAPVVIYTATGLLQGTQYRMYVETVDTVGQLSPRVLYASGTTIIQDNAARPSSPNKSFCSGSSQEMVGIDIAEASWDSYSWVLKNTGLQISTAESLFVSPNRTTTYTLTRKKAGNADQIIDYIITVLNC